MSPVRIIDISYVNPPATTAPPLAPFKLTSMEAIWIVLPPMQHVLLFEDAEMPPFDAVLQSLRSSLAMTLGSFVPLAGKLVHLKDTGDVAISCSASDSVKFVMAESDTDIRGLSGDEEHNVPVLEQLVPDVDMSALPTAVLAVQATRFEGGIAIGLTVHHSVSDGRSLWTFIEAWAAACQGETTPAIPPTFDRSLINLPGGEERARSILRERAPNFPLVTLPPSVSEDNARLFNQDMTDIQHLKQHIVRLGEADDKPLTRPPSTFVAIIPLAWTCFARYKPLAMDDNVLLMFLADVRGRLDPPVDGGYIGVCLTWSIATIPARELRGTRALVAVASAVQDENSRMNGDPADQQSHQAPIIRASWDRIMVVSGSSGFRAYDIADFGWGKPRRTKNIRMNKNGQVTLMRARDGHGVQVSVSLPQQAQMDLFKSHFLELVN